MQGPKVHVQSECRRTSVKEHDVWTRDGGFSLSMTIVAGSRLLERDAAGLSSMNCVSTDTEKGGIAVSFSRQLLAQSPDEGIRHVTIVP